MCSRGWWSGGRWLSASRASWCCRRSTWHTRSVVHATWFTIPITAASTPRLRSAGAARCSVCGRPWVASAIASIMRWRSRSSRLWNVRCWIGMTSKLETRHVRHSSVGFIRGIIQHVDTRRSVMFLHRSLRSTSTQSTRCLRQRFCRMRGRLRCVKTTRNEDQEMQRRKGSQTQDRPKSTADPGTNPRKSRTPFGMVTWPFEVTVVDMKEYPLSTWYYFATNRAAASAHKPPLIEQLCLTLRAAGKLGLTSPGPEPRPMIGDRRRRDAHRQLGLGHRRLAPERHVAFRPPGIPAQNGYGQCNDHPCSRTNPAPLHERVSARRRVWGCGAEHSIPGPGRHQLRNILGVFDAFHHWLALPQYAS